MLHYSTFDDAWGAPIAPKIINPYRQAYTDSFETGYGATDPSDPSDSSDSSEPETRVTTRPARTDEEICRDHLLTVYATQGPNGLKRILGQVGPQVCHQVSAKRRVTVFDVIDFDELMLFLFFGLVIYMLSNA